MSTVAYHRLAPAARETIRSEGYTIAGYVRAYDPDGMWRGDACGCPDDRCKDGFHHEPWDDCGCLAAILRDPSIYGLQLAARC
jgi:hypothetical protein